MVREQGTVHSRSLVSCLEYDPNRVYVIPCVSIVDACLPYEPGGLATPHFAGEGTLPLEQVERVGSPIRLRNENGFLRLLGHCSTDFPRVWPRHFRDFRVWVRRPFVPGRGDPSHSLASNPGNKNLHFVFFTFWKVCLHCRICSQVVLASSALIWDQHFGQKTQGFSPKLDILSEFQLKMSGLGAKLSICQVSGSKGQALGLTTILTVSETFPSFWEREKKTSMCAIFCWRPSPGLLQNLNLGLSDGF